MSPHWVTYRRLLGYTRPYWKGFALAMIGLVLAAAMEPLLPALMKPLLDQGFVAKRDFPIWIVPVSIIGIFIGRGIGTFTSNYALNWVAQKVLVDLRVQMFSHLMRLPSSEFQDQASGVLISRIVFEVTNVTDAATRVLTTVVRDSLVIVGLFGYLIWLNWKLTGVALALIPIMAFLVSRSSRRMMSLSRQSMVLSGELTHDVEEAVHGYKVVKIFDAYDEELSVFTRTVEKMRRAAMRVTVAAGAATPISQMCAALAMSIVISIALFQSQASQTTVGGFAAFVTAMLMLLAPLKHLGDVSGSLQRGLAAAEGVFQVLDKLPEADTGTRTLGRAKGAVTFENVTFRYPGADRDALREVSLEIAPGEVVALVGGSGGGKTTLVNLLPRFVAPTTGRLLIDGVPIADLTLGSLREQMALVSQDIVLFNDSVRANVAFGTSHAADDTAIWAALGQAALEDVVRALPGGLDAPIGERGNRLSGGQRQRLAIARALLKNAPILLLDEATSALDTETEREVQTALDRTMKGRTTLVIAHRLSTIEHADRIIVLEAGRIVEQGRHAELLARDGVYARLNRIQYATHERAG